MADSPWAAAAETLQRQWRESPIIRVGVLGVAAILGWYAQARLDDWTAALERDAEALQARLVRLERLGEEPVWPQRAEAAADLATRLEEQLWTAPTRGIAQADFQTWLERARARAGLEDLDQKLANLQPVDGLDGAFRARATLEGAFEPPRLWALLERIETHPERVIVEGLEIRGRRVKLTLLAYLRATGGERSANEVSAARAPSGPARRGPARRGEVRDADA